jgi:hypothetical protein
MLLRKKRREGILVGLVHIGLNFGINSESVSGSPDPWYSRISNIFGANVHFPQTPDINFKYQVDSKLDIAPGCPQSLRQATKPPGEALFASLSIL